VRVAAVVALAGIASIGVGNASARNWSSVVAVGSPIVVEGKFIITGQATAAPKGGTSIGAPYNRTWVFPAACSEEACAALEAKNLKANGSANTYTTDTGLVRDSWTFHRVAADGSSYEVRQGVSEPAVCVRKGKAIHTDPKGWTGEVGITVFVVKSQFVNGKRYAKGLDGAIVITGDYTPKFKAKCGGGGGTPVGAPATGGTNCVCVDTKTVVEFSGTRR
jgi:hypothetical protein